MAAARVAMQGGGGGVGSPMVFSGEEGEELCRSLHDQVDPETVHIMHSLATVKKDG